MRTKAPKDVVSVPFAFENNLPKWPLNWFAPVETVETKETAFTVAEEEPKPEPVKTQVKPAKETAASVKAKGKK